MGVQSVAARQSVCATGGWDNAICLWRWHDALASADGADGPSGAKQARLQNGSARAHSVPAAMQCAAQLTGHRQAVAGLAYASDAHLLSASWDHTLRRWDTHTGQAIETMATGKAQLCIAVPPADTGGESHGVVASGGADGVLRLWDTRAAGQEQLVRRLKCWQLLAHVC